MLNPKSEGVSSHPPRALSKVLTRRINEGNAAVVAEHSGLQGSATVATAIWLHTVRMSQVQGTAQAMSGVRDASRTTRL